MKKYKPTTPSRRHMTGILFRDVLTADKPKKSLTKGRKRSKGRNSKGRITTRHKGGGAKRLWRELDFKYNKYDIPAKVETIEYDPNRSGFIGLVLYKDGERRYHLLPKDIKPGDDVLISEKAEVKVGNRMPLHLIPVGTHVYNIEIQPKTKASLVRSAGNCAEVLGSDAGFTQIKMPSGEIRKINQNSWASIGQVSNEEHGLRIFGKAGRSRWKGIRPTVRGSAMNPVDHPYGGGEGKTKRGTKYPKTKWGKVTGGRKTRKKNKYSEALIVQRRKKKKK